MNRKAADPALAVYSLLLVDAGQRGWLVKFLQHTYPCFNKDGMCQGEFIVKLPCCLQKDTVVSPDIGN